MKIKKYFIVLAAFLLTNCSTFHEESVTYIDYPEGLNEARQQFANKNYSRAEDEVTHYLASTADVYWHGHAYLLLGAICENSGQDAKAVSAYKKVIGHGTGYHAEATAKALYRISWIYERESKYSELLVVLLDLQRLLGSGDNFIKYVELPARLANTYYILNQWDAALRERSKVTDQVLEKYQSLAKSPENVFHAQLYKSFLGMTPTAGTPLKSREILGMAQKDLLSVAETSEAEVAQRALGSLEKEYEKYFAQLQKLEVAKTPLEVSARNQKKLDDIATFVDFLEELKSSRRPPEVVAHQKMHLSFFEKINDYESRAKVLAQKLEIGIQKTSKIKNPSEKQESDGAKKRLAPQNKKL